MQENNLNSEIQGGYYAVIPATILNDNDLSATEKLLYGYVSQLSNAKGYCFASNKYLAEITRTSISTVSKGINKLIKKEYLKYEYEYEPDSREIKERHLYIGIVKNDYTYSQNLLGGIVKNDKENNINVNIKKDNTKVLSKEKRFVPPSKSDISEYCRASGYDIDVDMFYAYYSEGNWHDSNGNPVKNWKQKVITWHKKSKKPSNKMPDFTLKKKERKLSAEDEEILRRLREG